MYRFIASVVILVTCISLCTNGAGTLGDVEWAVSNTNGNSSYRFDCVARCHDFPCFGGQTCFGREAQVNTPLVGTPKSWHARHTPF